MLIKLAGVKRDVRVGRKSRENKRRKKIKTKGL
jgi:hypothetical protein